MNNDILKPSISLESQNKDTIKNSDNNQLANKYDNLNVVEKNNGLYANAADFGKNIINQKSNPAAETFLTKVEHNKILLRLLKQVVSVDFREKADLQTNEKLNQKHLIVICIDELLKLAKRNKWSLRKKNGFIYIYNDAYWKPVNKEDFQFFLSKVAVRMGINHNEAEHYEFPDKLYKQFMSIAHMPTIEPNTNEVLINLMNGTFVINQDSHKLRKPQKKDFLKYQLNFNYEPEAKAPKFESFLNRVLPDFESQQILAEYFGYIFTNHLKLEKALILYGSGGNGKSVFFDIINALLGPENFCSYSLQNLTKTDSYQRAELTNKLVNYASEINGKLESSIFKQLVSVEPVEARQIYSSPFIMTNYAKLIFNCNELPKEIEQTNAFFRRFLIIPFLITIPDNEQDKELAKKIINEELAGVFNWILQGLNRILIQKNFSECKAAENQLQEYKKNSDSVLTFIEEENYHKSNSLHIPLKTLFGDYRTFCNDNGYRPCSNRVFAERLKNNAYHFEKRNYGTIVFIEQKSIDNESTLN